VPPDGKLLPAWAAVMKSPGGAKIDAHAQRR
jgi:hypothetical protein